MSIKEVTDTDVIQAIIERRSIRKYRTEPVTEKALQTALETAQRAQSRAATGLSYESKAIGDAAKRYVEQ